MDNNYCLSVEPMGGGQILGQWLMHPFLLSLW